MRLLKTITILALAAALAIGAYLYWLLMTPVTAGNVQLRLTNYCYLGTKALQLNENAQLLLEKLERGSCSCLADKLVSESGLVPATALTEGARRLGLFGFRHRPGTSRSDGGLLPKAAIKDRLITEFADRYVTAANACIAAAGS